MVRPGSPLRCTPSHRPLLVDRRCSPPLDCLKEKVSVDSLPVISAGPDDELCFDVATDTYNLNGSVSIGSSTWIVNSGPGTVMSFGDANLPMTTFNTDANGLYELMIEVTNGVCLTSDTVELLLNPYPTFEVVGRCI